MEQRVHHSDDDHSANPTSGETTSVFRSEFLDELHHASAAAAAPETAEGVPRGSALLVVKRGPNAGARFLLDQPVTTVGRHPASDIFLDDATVSRRHAEFRRDEDASWGVTDVGSLNGTYVNRQPMDATVLAHGDEVQIGKFRLVFLTGSPTSHR